MRLRSLLEFQIFVGVPDPAGIHEASIDSALGRPELEESSSYAT
jgi:hypothetical protein